VDDVADAADTLAVLLGIHGFRVRTAPDGPSALATALADRPDVVLTDLKLPRMTGWELARELRARFPDNTPYIIAVTGMGQSDDVQQSAEAGIDLHLLKPADPDDIVAALERFRAGRGSERPDST
jgi:CheY-like chemotaxis protein